MWLYGPTFEDNEFRVITDTYRAADAARPLIVSIGSGLRLNHTYTMVVTVSNTAGNVSASSEFSEYLHLPLYTIQWNL